MESQGSCWSPIRHRQHGVLALLVQKRVLKTYERDNGGVVLEGMWVGSSEDKDTGGTYLAAKLCPKHL